MSKYMLSDEDSIDKINPYVQHTFSLPGAIGKPHPFEEYKEPVEPEPKLLNDNTHICETGITSGDKVIDTCRPSKVECRLSRPLIPGRNIDHGFTPRERMDFDKSYVTKKEVKSHEVSPTTTLISITCLILLIAVL